MVYTGDECLRCESQGRVPGKGTIEVRYGHLDGFICTTCLKELEDEGGIAYANYENEED